MNLKHLISLFCILVISACNPSKESVKISTDLPFTWENANVYFLMTDRFNNGDPSNDYEHTPDNPPAPYRGYMGGDIKGITRKINDGYFSELGINAIWMTPLVEQITGSVDEGTGNSFGFHGYWTRDWTALDSKFGTEADLKEMVAAAHNQGIRILIDVVANHTGPVTPLDSKWPDAWVKTSPRCTYKDYASTTDCTLVENLPDIRTESDEEVELPAYLIEKWKEEGRYDQEVAELDAWFTETGYKRTPVNYILKWLVDFIKEYGVDGFRVDTVKHTESYVWKNLWDAASKAFKDWKAANSDAVLEEDTPFYMVGEVYNYYVSGGRDFDYGDKKVDFYADGFKALINFDFKTDASKDYETIFSKYDRILHGEMVGKSILNYVSSHDDGGPFDLKRERNIESATKLMLCPGGTQIYYGDESARSLTVEAQGDATLRSFMNWDEIDSDAPRKDGKVSEILAHWQKLGKFRNNHPAIGAGRHTMIQTSPYVFSRKWNKNDKLDQVVVALDIKEGEHVIDVSSAFGSDREIKDVYNDKVYTVSNGKINIQGPLEVVLLEIN